MYGKTLVNNLPEETTNLLVKLCTGEINEVKTESLPEVINLDLNSPITQAENFPTKKKLKSLPEDFIHIFVNKPYWLTRFLEIMIQEQPDSSSIVYNTLLELYLKGVIFYFFFILFSFFPDFIYFNLYIYIYIYIYISSKKKKTKKNLERLEKTEKKKEKKIK